MHRGGQKNPVTVYHLIARDTVDEHVYGALAEKKKVVDAIMDYVKGEATEGDIRTIREDAVRERSLILGDK